MFRALQVGCAVGLFAVAAGSLAGASVSEREGPRPGADPGWSETSPGFVLPDDPLLREQWWLFNFGQEIGGRVRGTPGADIRAPEAWSITIGSPEVIVAVLDFGIDYDHPDFEGRLWTNPGETGDGRETNGADDDGNGYVDDWRGWDFIDNDNDPFDEDGHGTGVSGVIAANGGDAIGITGIAPGVRIMPLRVGGPRGVDLQVTPAAIEYAAANGARIVVMSYTTEPSGLFTDSDAETAAMLAHPEVLFITGAGNDGIDYRDFAGRTGLTPCNNPTVPNLICVAGTNRFDQPWEESTFGVGRVHIAAPAESMLLVDRPRQTLFDEDFADDGSWLVPDDMGLFWTPEGPAPTYAFGADPRSPGEHALRITHQVPDQVTSLGVLRHVSEVDLTGQSGCHANVDIAGSIDGSATVTFGFFREQDQRQNAFGGSYTVASAQLGATPDELVTVSFPLEAERLELAVAVQSLQFGDKAIDVALHRLEVVCWNPHHGLRDYAYWAGTSFATPLVAGVAALVASAEPSLGALEIRQAILESAVPLPGLEGLVQTGGRLDAYGALVRAAEIASGGAATTPSHGEPSGNGSPEDPDDAPTTGSGTGSASSFGSHRDYVMPALGQILGVPTSRDAADPAAPVAPEEPSAPSDSEQAAPPTVAAPVGGDPAGEEGGSGFPAWAWPVALFAAGAGGGVAVWVRRRASRAQQDELDERITQMEHRRRAEAEVLQEAEESRRRTRELADKEWVVQWEDYLRDWPEQRAGIYARDPRLAAHWSEIYPPVGDPASTEDPGPMVTVELLEHLARRMAGPLGPTIEGLQRFGDSLHQSETARREAEQQFIEQRTEYHKGVLGGDEGMAREMAERDAASARSTLERFFERSSDILDASQEGALGEGWGDRI